MAGEDGGEQVVYIAHDGDVGVEKDNGFIASKRKHAELDPRILEAIRYVSNLVFGRWDERFDGLNSEKSIVGSFELKGSYRGLGKRCNYEDNERILGSMLLQSVRKNEDAGGVV